MTKFVFLTGATGYIGGATLAHLLSSPSTNTFSYAVLVRNKEKASLLESLGLRPVLGNLDDSALLSAEAEKANVVIHTAESSDHVGACKAILEGMRRRNDNPILIHISGTGALMDDARGQYVTNEIYSDLDPDHVNSVPDSAFHRNVELMVLAASPKVRTHIISPPTIYGVADHKLAQMGISNPISIQIPTLIRVALEREQAGMVGPGLNVWPHVHISELAAAISAVFKAALEGKTATGREGYYFSESGEYSSSAAAAEIACVLYAKGMAKSEPTSFTDEEIQKYFGGLYYFGSNVRCRADRTRQLGWKSTHTTKDFFNSIGPEVDFILKKDAKT